MSEEALPALTYHITLSSQGGWAHCGNCNVFDAWSAEFGTDGETINRYLCLHCERYWIDARHVVAAIYVSPAVDALMANVGDALWEGYEHLHAMAQDAGMDKDVAQLNEWWYQDGEK